jgi:hypothetical protein
MLIPPGLFTLELAVHLSADAADCADHLRHLRHLRIQLLFPDSLNADYSS